MRLRARVRRWCHGLAHLVNTVIDGQAIYRAVTIRDRAGHVVSLECDCGRVFWRSPDTWPQMSRKS
jgi:hypothetical protein